ncbi:MAG: hypothetical protein QOF33_1941 [Thermomicrobiales bacterium]|nr:hypothetical protein [Thermomicrobiales bacterium]
MRRFGSLHASVAAILVCTLLVSGGAVSAAPAPPAPRTMAPAQDGAGIAPGNLNITADADGYQLLETVTAGWYIVTLTNTTGEDKVADFVLLPAGKKVEDLQNAMNTPNGGSTIPDWFEQVVFAGGPSALAHAEAQTLVELTAGTWTVMEVGLATGKTAELVVTASTGPATTPGLAAAVEMTMGSTKMEMPSQVPTGEQVWRVDNIDTLTHAFALIQLPASVTYDEMLARLTTGVTPEGLDMSKVAVVGGIGLLSGGRTIWTVFDLVPGYYAAIDYVPQKDGRTVAELGPIAMCIVP